MTADAFTLALADKMQRMFSQVDSGLNRAGTDIRADFATTGTLPNITPAQVIEVMQGESQWVQQFESRIEQQFESLAGRVLDHWLENTDRTYALIIFIWGFLSC